MGCARIALDDLDDLDVYEQLKSGVNIGEEGEDDEGEFIAYNCDVPDEMTDGSDEETVTGGTYYVFATYEDDDEIVAVDEYTIIGIYL